MLNKFVIINTKNYLITRRILPSVRKYKSLEVVRIAGDMVVFHRAWQMISA